MSNLIIIGTYNEVDNIETIILRIFRHITDVDILVIDDNSPDLTFQRVQLLQERHKNLFAIQRKGKLGLGSAYKVGFSWGLNRNYTNIGHIDADLSHRVRDLAKLIQVKKTKPELGLVIGSRWVSGGKTLNWPLKRQLLSRFANLYVRIMLRLPTNDTTAGFRLYDRKTLESIDFESIKSEGYAFHIEMTKVVVGLGSTIMEVPIVFRERESGVSKMSPKVVREAMFLVTVWGLKRVLRVK